MMTSVSESSAGTKMAIEESFYSDNATGDSLFNLTASRYNPNQHRAIDPMILVYMRYHFYGYPIVLTIGSIGNMLAYFVFTRTRLRKVSSIHYLAAIAVTDTCFLWTFIFTPLYRYHNVSLIVQAGICQLMMFLNYVFTFLSIWYLVAMVIEKFIGVYWPLKKTTMCTPFRAKLVMSFMAVIAVACYSYMGYFMGPDTFRGVLQCMPWTELKVHFANLSKIDTIIVAIIPYAVIILLTSLIVIRGCEYYRISAAVELCPRHTGSGNTPSQTTVRMTWILFPVIIFTIVTSLPVMILRACVIVFEVSPVKLGFWNQILYEFYIVNFASKLFVYVLFSSSFRRRSLYLLKSGYSRVTRLCTRDSSSCDSNPQGINLEPLQGPGHVQRALKTDI